MIRPALASDFDAVTPLLEQLWPGKPIDRTQLRSRECLHNPVIVITMSKISYHA